MFKLFKINNGQNWENLTINFIDLMLFQNRDCGCLYGLVIYCVGP